MKKEKLTICELGQFCQSCKEFKSYYQDDCDCEAPDRVDAVAAMMATETEWTGDLVEFYTVGTSDHPQDVLKVEDRKKLGEQAYSNQT